MFQVLTVGFLFGGILFEVITCYCNQEHEDFKLKLLNST